MSNQPHTAASKEPRPALLIVAAGTGSRMGCDTPKQYLKLDGLSLLRRSIESWPLSPPPLIQVVISESAIHLYEDAISGCTRSILPVVFGGTDRQSSVLNGLKALVAHKPTQVLIHDAARPCVPSPVYDDVLAQTIEHGAAVATLPQIDSLHEIQNGFIARPMDRSRFARAQTPQGFNFNAILKAHEENAAERFTDDVALAIAAGMRVKLVDGHEDGMKVTTPNDLEVLSNRLRHKPR